MPKERPEQLHQSSPDVTATPTETYLSGFLFMLLSFSIKLQKNLKKTSGKLITGKIPWN